MNQHSFKFFSGIYRIKKRQSELVSELCKAREKWGSEESNFPFQAIVVEDIYQCLCGVLTKKEIEETHYF